MTDEPIRPELVQLPGAWVSTGITHRGMVRRVNEDAFVQRPDVGIWAVADGMGGHEAGDVASHMIVSALRDLPDTPSLAQRLDAIDDTLHEVNRELVRRGQSLSKGVMGSTVVVLAVDSRGIGSVLWAGDSRAYRYRHQRLEQISVDHSQVEAYIEQGLITREQAASHPERNVITRALGSHPDETLEADLFDIAAGDRLLLCSDGLTRHISDPELAAFLAYGDTTMACQRMLDCALERGAVDNTTIVVVDVTDNR